MTEILTHWPLAFVCAAMIVAAGIDGWKLKVPNWLTFPLIISGWLLGLLHNFDLFTDSTGTGGIGSSLICTFLGMALLYPVYVIGGMGAGDVKMQMGFGAWVGAYYYLDGPGIVLIAFCVAAIVGGFLATGLIVLRGQFRHNLAHNRAILGDLVGAHGVTNDAANATDPKPRIHLLAY